MSQYTNRCLNGLLMKVRYPAATSTCLYRLYGCTPGDVTRLRRGQGTDHSPSCHPAAILDYYNVINYQQFLHPTQVMLGTASTIKIVATGL